jgi:hypothetical protein
MTTLSKTTSGVTTTITPVDVIGFSSTNGSNNILNTVIGRADVDVVFKAADYPSGTLTFLFYDLTTALACRNLHTSVGKIAYADAAFPATNMNYVQAGDIVLQREIDYGYWTVSVDYQAVV